MAYQPSWLIKYQGHLYKKKKLLWLYLTHCKWENGVLSFPKGISVKENVTLGREFEFAYLQVAVQLFYRYSTGMWVNRILLKTKENKAILICWENMSLEFMNIRTLDEPAYYINMLTSYRLRNISPHQKNDPLMDVYEIHLKIELTLKIEQKI